MKVAIIGTGFGLDVHYPVINEIKNLKLLVFLIMVLIKD